MFPMYFYRKIFVIFLVSLCLMAILLLPLSAQALDCREDEHCVLVQDIYCRTVKAVHEKDVRKWRRENVREMAELEKSGYVCPPALPSKLQIENYFPLCIGGTCVAGMIPGRE